MGKHGCMHLWDFEAGDTRLHLGDHSTNFTTGSKSLWHTSKHQADIA